AAPAAASAVNPTPAKSPARSRCLESVVTQFPLRSLAIQADISFNLYNFDRNYMEPRAGNLTP
ncbi:MAG TPA: hypothetical protein VN814_02215, partial [Caulobacteraceae bacterium]|nr:hypothetical protein [Caulobacteraceae bacterium]